MSFKYIEGIALAEAAFIAEGKDLKELFKSCAEAFFDTSANPATVKPNIKKNLNITGKNVEDLLYEFLEELVFIKDSEAMIFNKIEISDISETNLKAVLFGDKINQETQELKADVKAITMHKFNVEKTADGWKATVVMDI